MTFQSSLFFWRTTCLLQQKTVFAVSSTTFCFPTSHLLWTWEVWFHLFVLSCGDITKHHANLSIYQHHKSGNPVFNLNQSEWSFGKSVSFPETPTTDHTHADRHTHAHTRYPVVPYVTHVPHRGESSVPRANRLIMMPIHYQALQRPLPLFSIHSLRVAWEGTVELTTATIMLRSGGNWVCVYVHVTASHHFVHKVFSSGLLFFKHTRIPLHSPLRFEPSHQAFDVKLQCNFSSSQIY